MTQKITDIPEAALWAELVRRSVERERTGERSGFPKVTLSMVMGSDETAIGADGVTVVVNDPQQIARDLRRGAPYRAKARA